MSIPTALPAALVDTQELESCVGTFANAVSSIDIRRTNSTILDATVRINVPVGICGDFATSLVPAGNGLFIVNPPLTELLTVAQFVGVASRRPCVERSESLR